MTPNLLDELEGVVRVLDRAGKLDYEEYADGKVVLTGPKSAIHALAASTKFIRTHAPTLADMAKRLEAAERDAGRAKLEAERDFLDDWLQYVYYPIGMDCCGRGHGGDCCGDGVPVYATLPDVQQAMNKRLGEIEDAIAAIAATQEGEG